MNPRDDDRLDRLLTGLAPLPPDPDRAVRTRGRCRARLARPAWRAQIGAAAVPFARRIVEPAAAALAATVFLGDVIIRALQLDGVLPAP